MKTRLSAPSYTMVSVPTQTPPEALRGPGLRSLLRAGMFAMAGLQSQSHHCCVLPVWQEGPGQGRQELSEGCFAAQRCVGIARSLCSQGPPAATQEPALQKGAGHRLVCHCLLQSGCSLEWDEAVVAQGNPSC